jgi:hypothetical protein
MDETGRDVPALLLAGSDDVPPGVGLQRRVREQGAANRRRHGRHRMRVLVAAGAAMAVAAAGVTAARLAGSGSGAPSPLAAVTGALAETSAASYRFSVDLTVHAAGLQVRSDVVSGAFDPRRERGGELLTWHSAQYSAMAQIRFIGKYVYTWVSPGSGMRTISKPWDKAPVLPPGTDALPEGDLYGFGTEQPVSPSELLGVLRSAATVRDSGPASGPGWTGTRYTFTARLSARESVSGTVYVDQQGQVRRVVTITTEKQVTMDRDLTFGDFGAPVAVTAPTASQAEYTSRPYWEFFF